jgi:hypothetical protein
MAHRTDATGPAYEKRHFPEEPPFADLLESSELDYVEPGFGYPPIIAKVEGYLAMAFYSGYRFNLNLSGHFTCLHATSVSIKAHHIGWQHRDPAVEKLD